MRPFYDSYPDLYREVYAEAVVDVRPAGRTGAMLMRTQQAAGDWSKSATPDLVVVHQKIEGVGVTLDLGAGRFHTNLAVDNFAVVPPMSAATVMVDGAERLEVFAIPYAGLVALAGDDARLPPDGDFGILHSSITEDKELAQLFERLLSEIESGSPRGALYADSILLHLTARLLELRDGSCKSSKASNRGGLAPWQVKRASEAMIAAVDAGEEDPSMAELALMVGLSAHHFCHSFVRSTGLPPQRWMTRRRMERAVGLLGDHSLSLTDIAITLGYTSQSAFGRAFARVTGLAPSARRRELFS